MTGISERNLGRPEPRRRKDQRARSVRGTASHPRERVARAAAISRETRRPRTRPRGRERRRSRGVGID
eukprot:31416-Pelagococcus_subviridis.AAC.16